MMNAVRAVRDSTLGLCVSVVLCVAAARAGVTAQSWHAQYFPNIELTTHTGVPVRFYDLIKGKTVAIELIYTTCQFACPLETARLAQVQDLLGDRMGKDVFFLSISIDPAHDTPAVLKAFAEKYHAGPGWTFLTGKAEDIELLSKKLGLYSTPDPENKDGHIPALLIGNEATGQWMRGSALDNPKMTATMIGNWMGGYNTPPAVKMTSTTTPLKLTSGEYLFSTKCSACHGLGQAGKAGPDLGDVTRTRDRQWLAKYIANPDGMLETGDPIARELVAKYKEMRMPNLLLSDEQIRDVIAYLASLRPAPPK